jgi:DNA-binding response OmpR family regulator
MTEPPVESGALVLIVDDEPFNIDYLEQELEDRGFQTDTAHDGAEALERVAARRPDIVLLDVMMPGIDGITTLRVLKSDPETRLIPVVLMTALQAVEDRVRGIEAGADDFLSKPVDDRELLARIRTALRAKRAIDATVAELESTSAHLAEYGRQERDVAIVSVAVRPCDAQLPEEALGFVGRRRRTAAEQLIRHIGGIPSDAEEMPLVGVFDGSDGRARAIAAVEAALAVIADHRDSAEPISLEVSVGVAAGRATVGSARTDPAARGPRWVYVAEGDPVDRASRLAARGNDADVLIASEVAGLASGRFRLEGVAGDRAELRAHRVVGDTEVDARGEGDLRLLASILVTDIVGSTETAARLGDVAWADLLSAHDRALRDEFLRFGGEEIDTTGDGFLTLFNTPAAAVSSALGARDQASALGLSIRAGVHTGEVVCVGRTPRGVALNIAARVAARAQANEVLVSATTRELAVGSGFAFADRGEHELKGVEGPRRLFAVESTVPPEPEPR